MQDVTLKIQIFKAVLTPVQDLEKVGHRKDKHSTPPREATLYLCRKDFCLLIWDTEIQFIHHTCLKPSEKVNT